MGQRHQIYIHTVNPDWDRRNSKVAKTYGKKTTTNYVYHNQWLFGRNAIHTAIRVLEFVKWSSQERFSFFTDTKDSSKVAKGLEALLNVSNESVNPYIGNSFFLNEDEPEIRTDFTLGDNNDGITIIDTVSQRYCFMNIGNYDPEYGRVSSLPVFEPVSAEDYVTAYYPNCNDLEIAMEIAYLLERFKPFSVMTKEEIILLFPNVKELQAEPELV